MRTGRLPALTIAIAVAAGCAPAAVLYNTIPNPLPPNVVSLGYEATSTAEFGGLVRMAGSGSSFTLSSATVVMSDWALAADYESESAGFDQLLTLTIYGVGPGDTVGAPIATRTVNASIPWRPPSDPGCSDDRWLAPNGNCYYGLAVEVSFDLTGVMIPSEVIYGLSFDTQNYGANPTGVPGPYNSLNFGLVSTAPSVGSNPLPGTAYWNTSHAAFYSDGGAAGTGTFRQDTNWPYAGAIEFEGSVPEPATLPLFGIALAGLGLLRAQRGAARTVSRSTHASQPSTCRRSRTSLSLR